MRESVTILKQGKCDNNHEICIDCAKASYHGYVPNVKRLIEPSSNKDPSWVYGKFPIPDPKEEWYSWFEKNDELNGKEWYRTVKGKYEKRRNRPSWMNDEEVIAYEDFYIERIIEYDIYYDLSEEYERMRKCFAVGCCPLCASSNVPGTELFNEIHFI